MEIRDSEKFYIVTPLSSILNEYESRRIFNDLSAESRDLAIDLSYVTDCTIDFFELLKNFALERRLSLFNISAELFVLLNNLGIDKCIKLFVSELDFIENSREMVNRRFSIV